MSEPCRVITEEQYKEYLKLKQEKETLIRIVVRHVPELKEWIEMHFREKQNER